MTSGVPCRLSRSAVGVWTGVGRDRGRTLVTGVRGAVDRGFLTRLGESEEPSVNEFTDSTCPNRSPSQIKRRQD